ncbi:hypothetical protein [Bacillus cereus]|uniref:hypothetical protein n=1 Tax=Bacillus cereus TaxID=1396 RepID=UPI0009421040|nr:hypothetical protein [Bacillus cereus]
MRKSTFAQQQTEQEHIIKNVLLIIDLVADGQFEPSGRDITYDSTSNSYHFMMKQFKAVKEVLLQSDSNNKELISRYIAKMHQTLYSEHPFNLSRVVLILLGIEAQSAYDKQDEIAHKQILEEIAIWQDIIQRADIIEHNRGVL